MKKTICIAGAGGIGSAVGLLLRESGDFDVDLHIGDANIDVAKKTRDWIIEGSSKKDLVEYFKIELNENNKEFVDAIKKSEIILDCLPGKEAPRIARLAKEHNKHYANLTEYVGETEEIMKIAKGSSKGFLLQTGLAPGFINILANHLFKKFCKENEVNAVDTIKLRVGALTKNSSSPHNYGFTWSPIGVATEYLMPAIVVRDGKKKILPSLSERSRLIIDGIEYEEDLTSGGAADLPDALLGRVKTLDYKTLRYPGHYSWVTDIIKKIPDSEKKSEILQKTMEEQIPLTEDDIVIIYSSITGKDNFGRNKIVEKEFKIMPVVITGKKLKAIQSTTAAGLAESARLLLSGKYNGVILQSQINTQEFLNGPFISKVYGGMK